jgi:plastocyanin
MLMKILVRSLIATGVVILLFYTVGFGRIVIAEPVVGLRAEQLGELEGMREVRAGGTVEISIKDNKFDPADVVVTAGTKITFINNDSVPHRIKAEASAFESRELEPGQRWTTVISNIGEYPYSCAIHPDMQGKITVR